MAFLAVSDEIQNEMTSMSRVKVKRYITAQYFLF